ncbi:MAG: NTP transferase domain-containing protein [Eubacteriales bacterium]
MMEKKPVLVVLAAGLGSRYGGLKQLEPVAGYGQLIIDYSIFDAKRAGFEEVIFVIRPEMESAFQETIQARIGDNMKITYAYQELNDLPENFSVPEGRSKPWGTAHAALAARRLISGPFAIINADDFYGAEAYQKIYDFLTSADSAENHHGLVGYALANTVTEHGTVSRGICEVDENNCLLSVVEYTHIEKGTQSPRFSKDKGETWESVPPETIVSMNLWGFASSYLKEAEIQFAQFLGNDADPLTKEFYLPTVADQLIQEKKATVSVLSSKDLWYGITYPQDRPYVMKALETLTAQGLYPENLWEN